MAQTHKSPESAEPQAPHRDTAQSAQGVFESAAESVKDKAREVAEEQKGAGAERIEAVGRAVHGAADELGKEAPDVARYIHSAAETLESAASRLHERSIDEFIGGFNRFARDQPAAAFAGCVLAGFALSRFLKSSAH